MPAILQAQYLHLLELGWHGSGLVERHMQAVVKTLSSRA